MFQPRAGNPGPEIFLCTPFCSQTSQLLSALIRTVFYLGFMKIWAVPRGHSISESAKTWGST